MTLTKNKKLDNINVLKIFTITAIVKSLYIFNPLNVRVEERQPLKINFALSQPSITIRTAIYNYKDDHL